MLNKENQAIFNGPVVKTLFLLSLPIFAGMVFDLLYQVVDTYFLSLIDQESSAIIAGVGIIFPIFFIIIAITHGLMTGISTITAVAVGEKKNIDIKTAASTGLLLALSMGIILSVFFYIFFDSLVGGLAGNKLSAEALAYGKQYLRYIIFSPVILLCSHVLIGVLQGEGRTKQMGIAFLLSTIVNISLDPLFIFYFDMGVSGAALATIIAFAVVFIYAYYVFMKTDGGVKSYFSYQSINFNALKQIVWLSFPQTIRMLVLGASIMVFNFLVSSIGEIEMNAFTLVGRIDHIILTPAIAFSIGLSTMMGQNYGRQNYDRVKEIFKKGLLFIIAIVVGVSLIYISMAKSLFSLFTDLQSVLDLAVKQVWSIAFLFALGASIELSVGAAFQSIKKPFYSLGIIIIRFGLFAIPFALLALHFFGMKVEYVWYSIALGHILGAAVSYMWFTFYSNKSLLKTARGKLTEEQLALVSVEE